MLQGLARAATGREGLSDRSIQEEPSSQATLAVILLGDFFPPSFFFPLLTILTVFETIVDHHSIIVSLKRLQ